MAGLREKQKNERRQRIMDAAAALIRRNGGTHFTMQDLADEAGVSLATSYNLLGSKEGVLSALLTRQIRTTVKEGLVFSSDDPLGFIETAIEVAVDILVEDKPLMLPLYKYLFGVAEPEYRHDIMDLTIYFWGKVVDVVCLAIPFSEGGMEDIDKSALTYTMLAQFVGVLELWIYEDIDDAAFKSLSMYAGLLVYIPFLDGDKRDELLTKLDGVKKDLKQNSSSILSIKKTAPAYRIV